MNKVLRRICDFVTAALVIICVGSILSFTTIGRPSYYLDYYLKDSVSDYLEIQITAGTDEIASESGIEKGAFDYALSKKINLDRIKAKIPTSIFNGVNVNFAQTEKIDEAYEEGIIEYYELNGLEYDKAVVDKCVESACRNFDKIMGSDNLQDLSRGVTMVTDLAKVLSVVSFAFLVFFVTRIFALNYGRTKTFSHIGTVLISSGSCFVTAYIMNLVVDFVDRLDITSNEVILGGVSYGVDKYFRNLGIIGVILITLGIVAMKYVYGYYVKKYSYNLQEKIINQKVADDAKAALELETTEQNIENGDRENGIG